MFISVQKYAHAAQKLTQGFCSSSGISLGIPSIAACRNFSSRNASQGNTKVKTNKKSAADDLTLTDAEEQALLGIFNEYTEEELMSIKNIATTTANRVAQYREKNGLFKSFRELNNIEYFPFRWIVKTLKNEGGKLPLNKVKTPPTFAEILTQEQRANIQSIVSIDLGFKHCAWLHITRDLKVQEWKKVELSHSVKPYRVAEFAQETKKFVSMLPKADIYLLELQSIRSGVYSPGVHPFMINLRVLEAMIHCFLLDHFIISVCPKKVKKFFQLLDGSNKKNSAVRVVHQFIMELQDADEYYSVEMNKRQFVTNDLIHRATSLGKISAEDLLRKVEVPKRLIKQFEKNRKQDDLSDSLLQALFFISDAKLMSK